MLGVDSGGRGILRIRKNNTVVASPRALIGVLVKYMGGLKRKS